MLTFAGHAHYMRNNFKGDKVDNFFATHFPDIDVKVIDFQTWQESAIYNLNTDLDEDFIRDLSMNYADQALSDYIDRVSARKNGEFISPFPLTLEASISLGYRIRNNSVYVDSISLRATKMEGNWICNFREVLTGDGVKLDDYEAIFEHLRSSCEIFFLKAIENATTKAESNPFNTALACSSELSCQISE